MSGITERLSKALADRYRLEREVGAGGMATVYLAHDLRHDRQVAIKVLHPDLAAALGGERFLAEIKTTARLQNPHILPLLDSGAADGLLFYVMPFVAGETLRARLERERQLPVEDALRITREVADALAAAHAQGIIHRDIKPENILLQGGHALVADFGIALAVSAAGGQRMTQTGLSLGTPQYMSPEQAMGERQIDARTDQYALAAVTYEMLVGEPPFTGPSVQAIVARVLSEEPRGVTTQRRAVPMEVEATVLRGLEKLPADRFASVEEFAASLGLRDGSGFRTAAIASARAPSRSRLLVMTALLVVMTALSLWGWLRPTAQPRVVRYRLTIDSVSSVRDWVGEFAISPDGRVLVHVGGASRPLGVRRADSLHFRPLPGTEGAQGPFFSPDGMHVGFYVKGTITAVPLAGGPPVVMARGLNLPVAASWSPDGYLYRDWIRPDGRWSLGRQLADGSGAPEQFTVLDTVAGESAHGLPEPLPEGTGVLFRLEYSDGRVMIAVADAGTGRHRALVDGSRARYAQGRLVYSTTDGRLWSVGFDPRALRVEGTPVLVGEGVPQTILGPLSFALSRSGTLVHAVGDQEAKRELAWISRTGVRTPFDRDWVGAFVAPAISPDGRRVAVTVRDGTASDIWVREIARGPALRLTTGNRVHEGPAWSPDGRTISFHTAAPGVVAGEVWGQRADGSEPATRLAAGERPFSEHTWSPTGGWLAVRTTTSLAGSGDVLVIRPGVDSAPSPLLSSRSVEYTPTVSPDGRWMAYVSNESGRLEVYVTSFPRPSNAKWQVSTAGGTAPRWSPKGDEIFYLDLGSNLVSARVDLQPSFAPRGTQQLFPAGPMVTVSVSRRNYDVSPDAQRFLVVLPAGGESRQHLVVVENWIAEQRRKAP